MTEKEIVLETIGACRDSDAATFEFFDRRLVHRFEIQGLKIQIFAGTP